MKYYIDSENVGPGGLDGIGRLSSDDEVIIFIRNSLPKKMKTAANNTNANVVFRNVVGNTKQAMDFVIVATVGMNKCPGMIISNDKGYTPAIMLMQSAGIQIQRFSKITDALFMTNKKNKKKKKKHVNVRAEIGSILAHEIAKKGKRKQAINMAMSGQIDALDVCEKTKIKIRKICD